MKIQWLSLVLGCLFLSLSGCLSDESIFTEGKLEDPCNTSIPVCNTQAACVLQNDEYYSNEFPGGTRLIVRTQTDKAKLIARFLLTETLFPGTEIQVQAYDPGCGEFEEVNPKNIDLFELAGDDRTLEFQLELNGKGDHLVEIFSDMSAQYLMTLTVEE